MCFTVLVDIVFKFGKFVRATESEAEVFKFRFDIVEAEAVGERGVEVVGFAGDLHLFVGAHGGEGTHIVESVGEFYEEGSDVILEAIEHLAVIVDLL